MKIPAAAMGEIKKAVMSMLPYEEDRTPESPESKMVQQIFDMLGCYMSEFEDLKGFIQFMTKSIDDSPGKQESTKKVLLELQNVLNDYEV